MLYNSSHILLHYEFNVFSKPLQETNRYHTQLTRSILVMLIVGTDAGTQVVQGSNLAGGQKAVRRLTAYHLLKVCIVNNTQSQCAQRQSKLTANFAFNGGSNNIVQQNFSISGGDVLSLQSLANVLGCWLHLLSDQLTPRRGGPSDDNSTTKTETDKQKQNFCCMC